MKTILFWKYADIAGQALMLLPLMYLASPDHQDYAFATYFTLGAWQAVSCATTAFADVHPKDNGRKAYSRLLAWILIIFTMSVLISWMCHQGQFIAQTTLRRVLSGLVSFLSGTAFLEAAIMLCAAPVLALWYLKITLSEAAILRHAITLRTDIHWKQ